MTPRTKYSVSRFANRVRIALILIFLILVVGVIGYMFFEDYTLVDSLYMTVITVATVGFREVRELSDSGKLFTIFLIITSLGTFAYSVTIITTHLIEDELSFFLKRRKSKIDIKKMKNHIIVCGYGRNGMQTSAELLAHNTPFVVIEQNGEIINKIQNQKIITIEGDATEDSVLEKANIKNAKGIITTLPNDADNLFVTLTARSIKPKIIIISRASSNSAEKKLKMAGANNVIMPDIIGGSHMASLIIKPDVVEFLDHIAVKDQGTNLEEIVFSRLPEECKNHSLSDLEIRQKTGANIIGYKTPEGNYIINPSPETVMIPGSKLFVLGTREQIKLLKAFFDKNSPA